MQISNDYSKVTIKSTFSRGRTGVSFELKIWHEHEIDVFARFLGVSVAVLFERSGIKDRRD